MKKHEVDMTSGNLFYKIFIGLLMIIFLRKGEKDEKLH